MDRRGTVKRSTKQARPDKGTFVKLTHAELNSGLIAECGSPLNFTVYCILRAHRRHEPGSPDHGLAWPSPETLASRIKKNGGGTYSTKAIQRSLSELCDCGHIVVARPGIPNVHSTYYTIDEEWKPEIARARASEARARATTGRARATNPAGMVAEIVAPTVALARTEEAIKEISEEHHQSEDLMMVVEAFGSWKQAVAGKALTDDERAAAAQMVSKLTREDFFAHWQAELLKGTRNQCYRDPLHIVAKVIELKREELARTNRQFEKIHYAFEAVQRHVLDMAINDGWKAPTGLNVSQQPASISLNSPNPAVSAPGATASAPVKTPAVTAIPPNSTRWAMIVKSLKNDSGFGARAGYVLERLQFSVADAGTCILTIPPHLADRARGDLTTGRKLQVAEAAKAAFGPNVIVEYRQTLKTA